MPADIERTVRTAADRVKDGRPGQAIERLDQEFDSVCDTDRPAHHPVGDRGRLSYCHRHRGDYEDVGPVLDRRHGQ